MIKKWNPISKNTIKNYFIVFAAMALLSACSSYFGDSEKTKLRETAKLKFFNKVYNENNLPSQKFTINPKRDTLLTGKKGTKVRIYANTFAGIPDNVKTIDIELKEAITKQDFVLGNLTTVSKKGILRSDGMLYLNATANGAALTIKDGKEIGIVLPTKSVDQRMNVYEGIKNDSSITWVTPTRVANTKVKEMEQTFKTVWYYPKSRANPDIILEDEHWKKEDIAKRYDWFWESGRKPGDTLLFDKYFVHIVKYTLDKVKLAESGNGVFLQEVITSKGTNGFIQDYNTNYIFSLKKLGWANIDKLFKDPKSEEINLVVNVENAAEFDYVFTSMIFDNRNIYVPGYQRSDNTYGFTQQDSDKLILPLNEEVTLLTTAYKGDQPYFALTKFKLKSSQEISSKLVQRSIESIKKELEEKI